MPQTCSISLHDPPHLICIRSSCITRLGFCPSLKGILALHPLPDRCFRGYNVLLKVWGIVVYLFPLALAYLLAVMLTSSLCIFEDKFQDHDQVTPVYYIPSSVLSTHFTLYFQYSTYHSLHVLFFLLCISFPVDVEPLMGSSHVLLIFVSPTVLCQQIFIVLCWF